MKEQDPTPGFAKILLFFMGALAIIYFILSAWMVYFLS